MNRGGLILACLAVVVALLAAAPASAACLAPGGRTSLTSGTPVAGDVDNGQVDKYVFTVPAGQVGYIALQMLNGDIDMLVCNNSTNAEVCSSHNSAGIMDGCHVSEASIPLPSPPYEEGSYLAEWGNAVGPGTYRLDVKHCFSSVDGAGCDYADLLELGDPFTGALDGAPPVQYVVLFSAQ